MFSSRSICGYTGGRLDRGKVFQEVPNVAKNDRSQLGRMLDQLVAGDVVR